MKIEVVVGDLVGQTSVEAIVNATNANIKIGQGTRSAIHLAAGPKLETYCRPFAPLELGAALITPGFKLSIPWIIHIRLPHYINNVEPERYLAFALFSMLNTAKENRIKTIALPPMGVGNFKFPSALVARIMSRALHEFAKHSSDIDLVRICVDDEEERKRFLAAVEQSNEMVACEVA